MILADKIIRLRKKNGWSQEEFSEKMNVSRQAVSKWEGAQSIPDIEKILLMSQLFGVTTDYLLKDEIEDEEFTDTVPETVRKVTLSEANEFIGWRKTASIRIAIATFLCILAVIPLIVFGTLSEYPQFGISENFAGGVGLIVLICIVAVAVSIFVHCGFKNAPFDFLDGKEEFETEYGVKGMVKERQKAYRNMYVKFNIIGTCVCVLSPVALFIGAFSENEILLVAMLAVTIAVAGIGAMFFIIAGVRWASMQKLLKEGEFTLKEKKKTSLREAIGLVYWLTVTAIFFAWSFIANGWMYSWVMWPIAGVIFAAVMVIANLFIDKDK